MAHVEGTSKQYNHCTYFGDSFFSGNFRNGFRVRYRGEARRFMARFTRFYLLIKRRYTCQIFRKDGTWFAQ
jgi:hypothetical protein